MCKSDANLFSIRPILKNPVLASKQGSLNSVCKR